MHGGSGNVIGCPFPCFSPSFGAISVGLLKLITGPLSVLGLYWTVYIFLGSDNPIRDYDAALYRANGQEFLENIQIAYSFDALQNIFYGFFFPACFPIVSGICVFIALIRKNSQFLHWSLIFNLLFITACIIIIILICCQGIKFLATLPLFAIMMLHVYFLVVISLFKEWVLQTNHFAEDRLVSESQRSASKVKAKTNGHIKPPPPPIPPRSILAHSNVNSLPWTVENHNGLNGDIFQATRVVTVTSV